MGKRGGGGAHFKLYMGPTLLLDSVIIVHKTLLERKLVSNTLKFEAYVISSRNQC